MHNRISQRRPQHSEVIGAKVNILQTIVDYLHVNGIARSVSATRSLCIYLCALAAMGRVILGHRTGLGPCSFGDAGSFYPTAGSSVVQNVILRQWQKVSTKKTNNLV
jgi:hypothetical protein